MSTVKQHEPADQTEPVTEAADAPPSPDHLVVLGIETCIHCEQPRGSHVKPFFACWDCTTFFEAGPSRAQLTEALDLLMHEREAHGTTHGELQAAEAERDALVAFAQSVMRSYRGSTSVEVLRAFERLSLGMQERIGLDGTDPEKSAVQP